MLTQIESGQRVRVALAVPFEGLNAPAGTTYIGTVANLQNSLFDLQMDNGDTLGFMMMGHYIVVDPAEPIVSDDPRLMTMTACSLLSLVGLEVQHNYLFLDGESFVRMSLVRLDGTIVGCDSLPRRLGAKGIYASVHEATERVSLALVNALDLYVANGGARLPQGAYLEYLRSHVAAAEKDCRVED